MDKEVLFWLKREKKTFFRFLELNLTQVAPMDIEVLFWLKKKTFFFRFEDINTNPITPIDKEVLFWLNPPKKILTSRTKSDSGFTDGQRSPVLIKERKKPFFRFLELNLTQVAPMDIEVLFWLKKKTFFFRFQDINTNPITPMDKEALFWWKKNHFIDFKTFSPMDKKALFCKIIFLEYFSDFKTQNTVVRCPQR